MIILILLIATLLRLINLNQSLWLDEAIEVVAARGLSFYDLVFTYSRGDFHPPFYHLILRAWTLLFGSSEIAVRMPSVILGVATVYVTYLIAKKLFEEKTALVAATLIATGPLAIYYSQEARMYTLAAFLTACAVYFFVSILDKDSFFKWIGFIVSTALMLYTDYLPYFMIPTIIVFLFLFKKKIPKSAGKSFLPALILIIFSLTPWIILLPNQLSVGLSAASASPAWSKVVGEPSFKNLAITFVKFIIGRISHDNNLTYAFLFAPVALFTAMLCALSIFRMSPKRIFLWFWVLVPILLSFAFAYFVPVFAYFRFIFVLPAFYIILASGITTINAAKFTRPLLFGAIAINLTATLFYFAHPKFQRENWKAAVSYVTSNADPKTVVLFESQFVYTPFNYYNQKNIEAKGVLEGVSDDNTKIRENVAKFTEGRDKVFLFQYLSEITDPGGLAYQEITKANFQNTATQNFDGVGFVYEFRR